ncbi:aminoglycoside phosphotransferase family protein [Glycomyces sp. NRRL B-16210]|uniref:aminoglycoside phosphotransferase family protein n=1 Tax=Glycomyces sp. NRRL B-16210 TaxID=1463821 RepID=UPI0004BFE973|nr:aminoglycoside phosphotransferase family protein [Glycomyces sp. NRRL B-16210]
MGDTVIDEAFVRALVSEGHPDLAGLALREVDGGWDNRMWRLGDDLAVRLPRTPRAPALLEKEHRWLPALAPLLPLPVPVPLRLGEPTSRFPETWTVTTWVPGEPADRAAVARPESADALADFLLALHREAPADAPANPDRGVPLRRFAAGLEDRLDSTDAALRAIWDDALAAPDWDRQPVWLHGDLHPANIVVTDGALAGVIDFGELCAGDPATDLSAAWLLLPDGGAARCLARYDADEDIVRRARGWALLRALGLVDIGRAGDRGEPGGKPTWRPAGEAALARLAS